MFAVTVTFQITPGQMQAFLPLMLQNARTSLQAEAGCRQFDVATDPDFPDEVFLYELYTSPAAFQTHLASMHFKEFDAQVEGMIAAKTVRRFREVR